MSSARRTSMAMLGGVRARARVCRLAAAVGHTVGAEKKDAEEDAARRRRSAPSSWTRT